MIPLLHDFADATVVVFGGGPVGARKARRFAREARVIVVSPTFAADDFGGAARVRAAPGPDDVRVWIERTTPALAVAATDDEAVNEAVGDAARDRGILVNRADRSGGRDAGSVVVPATVRDGPVVVAVATGGRAPALSRHLRQELAEPLEGAGAMAELLAAARSELQARDVPPEQRREVVADLVESPSVWTTLRTGTANPRQVIEDVLAEDPSDGGETS